MFLISFVVIPLTVRLPTAVVLGGHAAKPILLYLQTLYVTKTCSTLALL